jgi:hypothetical protein
MTPQVPGAPGAFPIHVPKRLLEAFQTLGAEPVLSGGAAVQVWTGRSEGLFATQDLDFITHLRTTDLERAGIALEDSGRHALVDGVALEFPPGPLAVADLYLDSREDTVLVPTLSGEGFRCIRPEACTLDRLAMAAGWKVPEAFLQAAAVVITQAQNPAWDEEWMDRSASKAGLGRIWAYLKTVLERGHPTPEDLDQAMQIGLGS